MKKILFLILFCISIFSSAQEDWMFIQTGLTGEYDRLIDAFPIGNENAENFALFLKQKKSGTAYLINKNKNILSEIVIDNLPHRCDFFAGSWSVGKLYNIIFTNANKTRYGSVLINFQSGDYSVIDDLKIPLKKQRTIEHFANDKGFYILTSVFKTSHLKVYEITINNTIVERTIDLSNETFETSNGMDISLFTLLFPRSGIATIKKIELSEPNSIEVTSADNKLYVDGHNVILTSDYLDRYTYFFNLDLKEGTCRFNRFEHATYEKDNLRTRSNSFIDKNHYYSIYSTVEELIVEVYDFKKNELIKRHVISKHQPISIKNTPIILEGGDFSKYRELDRTAQFLRKIASSNIGISVHKNQDNYIMTLGASKKVQSGNMAIVGGILGGVVGGVLFSAFDSYSHTKSTRISGMFDLELNHLEGEIPLNSFDRIKEYSKDIGNAPAQTIFKHNNNYVWGAFGKESGIYKLVKFKNE